MFLTLEECSRAWKEAGQHGSKEERIARNARWISFYNYAANAQAGDISGPDAHSNLVESSCEALKIENTVHAGRHVRHFLRRIGIF